MASSLYEPSPRIYHSAVQVQEQSYLWGGLTQDFLHSSRSELMNVFNSYNELWKQRSTTGVPPPGLYAGASTLLCEDIYYYGGTDGKQYFNTLHKLQTRTLEWQETAQNDAAGGPQPKIGCGMVAYQQQLALIGGFGPAPTGPLQSGAEFIKSTKYPSHGWTNEFHLFNVKEGKWSSPPTTGPRPPPGAGFTFTAVNHHKAVMFGGDQPGRGLVSDIYTIDFGSMVWTRLEKPQGAPWPVGRGNHAACCLNYGDDHPVLLMTGGVDQNYNTLNDAWLLDVHSGRWKELTLPEGTQPRYGHTLTACNMEESRVHATTFGGCPSYVPYRSVEHDPKLAETTVLEFESVQSGDDPSSRQWVLVGVADSSQLGSPERMRELEKLKQRKTEHERGGNIWKLQKEVLQLEEKVVTAQRKARLALARAVRAEQEADQVPVLEQQLSETRANLEEQIHMKDEASVAAQQQSDQTRATLEHQILVRDQTNATLQRTYYQMKATLEHQIELREQARVSIQHQFHQMKSALEHQLREKEQVRVALEAQLRAKDQEKGELEQQLYRKDEHIRALQRSQIEQVSTAVQSQEKATQVPEDLTKPSQVHISSVASVVSYDPTSQKTAVEVAEVQKVSGDGQVIAQEEVAIAQQLIETRGEVGAKEEELRQITELELELESKNLEVTFLRCDGKEKDDEIATIKRHTTEEKKVLQSQVDSLQQDLRRLQQKVAEKDNQITAVIRSDNQDRLEKLEQEKQELTTQMDSLEARCREVEFFRDTYSWEVDQLRDDLMEKEVEIDFLRKEQMHTMPTSVSASSSAVAHFSGAEVIAQTTFTLTQELQNLQFKGYGFKLHVPEGSLPAEISEAKLKVQVSLSGQFQMPPDCELLSAVYWVYSPHKFTKPLTIEIQHCAALSNDEQCSQLSFVSTKCTQKDLPYVFKIRDGGVFSRHSSYGSLPLSQFSGFAVSKRKVSRRARRVQPYPSTSKQTIHQSKQVAPRTTADTEVSKLSTPSVGAVESLETVEHDRKISELAPRTADTEVSKLSTPSVGAVESLETVEHDRKISELAPRTTDTEVSKLSTPSVGAVESLETVEHNRDIPKLAPRTTADTEVSKLSTPSVGAVESLETVEHDREISELAPRTTADTEVSKLSTPSVGAVESLETVEHDREISDLAPRTTADTEASKLSTLSVGAVESLETVEHDRKIPELAPKTTADTEVSKRSTPSVGAVENLETIRLDKEISDQYCGQVYTNKGVNDCKVYFVITKNLDAHRTFVEQEFYSKLRVREDIEMSLGFEGEMIALSIPRSGEILESGWTIKPRYDPIIRKENVDHFSHGQMIPKCELLLRWPQADKPHVCLEHEINLIGAKCCSFFTLYIPDAASDTPTPSPAVSSPSSESSMLSPRGRVTGSAPIKPQLKDLMGALYHKVADRWKMIGVYLEIPSEVLAGIAEKCRDDPHRCLIEMLETWTKRFHPPASWATVIEAVEFLGEERLGRELRDKHM